ncbi:MULTISPECIES: right-handed parallel beta-helix repeat-containing protein [Dysgonomonas]|uniref:right-handed parallel beta-helix repeat-containing protein n=1 Tax=Dysgonomonas TaxID=156973 RepID=UPI000928811B|nr:MULTISPECIES: right-handed parallel beta-helix repeat-containing protein [Dysgonomonas]MBN9302545.1 hypothetical protein [Dysgonomonas mossii]OJX59475.1 MAG: hypothetical protein BGO84_12035 [Dysgonomonas sp. 37-18]
MKFILSILFLSASFQLLNAKQVIQITDFGAIPDSRKDIVNSVKEALTSCSGQKDMILNFPKGRYDFWPSHCDGSEEVTIGFDLNNLKNITIEGNGSEFIFHGRMQIAMIHNCEGITFRNFSVDWDRPYISQAEIIEATDSYLDIKMDKQAYPYVIENDKIAFVGEGWRSSYTGNNLFDKNNKEILPQTWDGALGDIFQQKVEERNNGVLRFYGKSKILPPKGTIVSMAHARYLTVGFHIHRSKDTLLKNITIYHALSHGVLGELSENITMYNASMTVNEAKGRIFSIVADASHFINCKGVIKVENCTHTGQGDDFINVHGRNIIIQKIVDAKSVEVKEDGIYNTIGDEIWFLNKETAQRGEIGILENITPIKREDGSRGFLLSFTDPLPKDLKVGDFIENKTWSASLVLKNCKILKKHRARGILVTTPKEVIIENNYFHTAGAAILIEGDIDYWFESGANCNVRIENNIFEDCLTSGNRDGDRWQWGDAIISITPSHRPVSSKTEAYHKNIHVENNIFKVFDAPLVRARSVKGLFFTNNEVIKTKTYEPYTWQKSAFLLDGCRDVIIENNSIDDNYETRDILIEHMTKDQIKVGKDQNFKIDFVKNIKTYLN